MKELTNLSMVTLYDTFSDIWYLEVYCEHFLKLPFSLRRGVRLAYAKYAFLFSQKFRRTGTYLLNSNLFSSKYISVEMHSQY